MRLERVMTLCQTLVFDEFERCLTRA